MSSGKEEKQQLILIIMLVHNIGYLILCYLNVINESTIGIITIACFIQLYLSYLAIKYKAFGYIVKKIRKVFNNDS